jgi:hypothetical protein
MLEFLHVALEAIEKIEKIPEFRKSIKCRIVGEFIFLLLMIVSYFG